MFLAGILLSTSSFAQSNTLFNPDYNGDGFIGVDDILGALSFYDTAWDGPVSPSWSCGEPVGYAGVAYSTVQIGDQCWFAENLRTTTYLNGEAIPQNLSNGDWSITFEEGAMAFYTETTSVNGPAYGGLYSWLVVDDDRGLCPSGWHVPTDVEWTVMIDLLGGVSVAGGQMKATYGWYYGGNGANSSGFSGLPGGHRDCVGNFFYAGGGGNWWSSSSIGYDAHYRSLDFEYENVGRGYYCKRGGLSVRCVRDAE
jgi:uncharacterized protein (TIGR02145 family)